MSNPWYVARIQAGATRPAKDRLHTPDDRKGESIVEQAIRDAGFRCYLPRMRKEITHHRSKKKIVRAFPLFTGYIFVDRASGVGSCDGVAYVLGSEGRPFPVPGETIEAIMRAQDELVFDDTREAKIKRKEIGRTRRETAAMRYPVGSILRVTGSHPFAGFSGSVTGVTGKGLIRCMMEIFGGLVPVEVEPSEVERLPVALCG